MTRATLLDTLANRVAALRLEHPVRVAIDGVDASGKTTLADELRAPLESRGRTVLRASVDGFHRPAVERRRLGADSPEGYYRDSFDYPRLLEWLLVPLGPGGSLRYRRAAFDHRTERPVDTPTMLAPADAILLVDGVFLLRHELRDQWDYSIFVKVGFDVVLRRAESRDRDSFASIEELRRRYERRYIPGQRLYLAEADPERRASAVVWNDDPASPRLVRID